MKYAIQGDEAYDFGFAKTCLTCGAISVAEFHAWIYHVIEVVAVEDVPSFFYDLLDCKTLSELHEATPVRMRSGPNGLPSRQESAIDGIAYLRRTDFSSDAVSRRGGLEALERNPDIRLRFERLFPFLAPLADAR